MSRSCDRGANHSNLRTSEVPEGGACEAGEAPKAVAYQTPFPMRGAERAAGHWVYRLAGTREARLFRDYADALDGFVLRHHHHDHGVFVWERRVAGEAVHVIKVFAVFGGVRPGAVYDMLQDAVFRETWDGFRLAAFRLARLDARNDVGYYAARSPVPLVAPRDFVNQRAWHAAGRDEFVIFNTAVPAPGEMSQGGGGGGGGQGQGKSNGLGPGRVAQERCVRAVSKLTGYLLQPWHNPATGALEGTAFTYLTHVDPRGSIPKTLMNYVTTKFAPKVIKRFAKALRQFEEWLPAQLAAGTYTRDWVTPEEWWVSEEEEAKQPIRNLTIDFARERMKKS